MVLYSINATIFYSKRIEKGLWTLIKTELFYIGGQCQHSGNCCKNIQLFEHQKPLLTFNAYENFIKKNPAYKIFKPKTDGHHTIKRFDCTQLSAENRCMIYPNRPQICHDYPSSYFIATDNLKPSCGYQVSLTSVRPKIWNASLKTRVIAIKHNHNLLT